MINEALRLLRVYHDLKQAEAAERLGISKSYLSEIENGHKEPSLDLIRKYETAFGIPASSILFFAENMGRSVAYERARSIVAPKILRLMQYLEERSNVA